ncbi:FixH family protein [Methylobacterium flocculans]|jgi:nitrogen fixation protein FixH|uniref:FixH family protein n=1 Tax=Methylobacterium flocculans TaxID=2984843 RepID=UPI0021F3AF45|nr:FixH family protein [Methylobacterium sp. FF17]
MDIARKLPTATRGQFRLTGTKVLALFAAFFGTIASADAILVASALRTWSGLEVASPYQASQHFNEETRTARRHEAQGWRLASRTHRDEAGGLELAVTLQATDGSPLAGRRLQARFERPTDKRSDLGADLTEAGPGEYVAHLASVAAGQWNLVVDVVGRDGSDFRRRSRLVLP